MILVTVPFGQANKVIEAANEAGATGMTIIRARGKDNPAPPKLFGLNMESEQELILIALNQKITAVVCNRIRNEFVTNKINNGSIYILPIQ